MKSSKRNGQPSGNDGRTLAVRRLEAARAWISALSSPNPETLKALGPHLAADVSTPWASGRAEVLASIRGPVRGFVEGSWSEPKLSGTTVKATCDFPPGEDRDAAVVRLQMRSDVISAVEVIFFNRKKKTTQPRTRPSSKKIGSTHPEVQALFTAMDAQREERGLTWPQVAREVNASIRNSDVHPLSASTIQHMRERHSLNMNGVLQMMVWLDRSPESFSGPAKSKAGEKLPHVAPGSILRFDVKALYSALEERRAERGMKWTQVAAEVGGFTASGLTRLKDGGLIGYPHVMRLTRWVGKPVVAFVYVMACD